MDGLDVILEEAAEAHRRARASASKVVVGFTIGAEVEAIGKALARFERTEDPGGDLERARDLLARAKRAASTARRQRKDNSKRTTTAAAAMIISRKR